MCNPGRILAHRGYLDNGDQPNSLLAFLGAAERNLGIELDIRDQFGRVVVSHDPASRDEITLEETLALLRESAFSGVLALNVKAEGLLNLIGDCLATLRTFDYFFFDMSVPETRKYLLSGLRVAFRWSEFESLQPNLLRQATDSRVKVWLDCFESDWWLQMAAEQVFQPNLDVFVVSPELHGRDRWPVWERLANLTHSGFEYGLCTDFPDDFLNFVNA